MAKEYYYKCVLAGKLPGEDIPLCSIYLKSDSKMQGSYLIGIRKLMMGLNRTKVTNKGNIDLVEITREEYEEAMRFINMSEENYKEATKKYCNGNPKSLDKLLYDYKLD